MPASALLGWSPGWVVAGLGSSPADKATRLPGPLPRPPLGVLPGRGRGRLLQRLLRQGGGGGAEPVGRGGGRLPEAGLPGGRGWKGQQVCAGAATAHAHAGTWRRPCCFLVIPTVPAPNPNMGTFPLSPSKGWAQRHGGVRAALECADAPPAGPVRDALSAALRQRTQTSVAWDSGWVGMCRWSGRRLRGPAPGVRALHSWPLHMLVHACSRSA